MQLQALAAGNSQCAVAQFVAQIEFAKQLIGRQLSAGNRRAHHENVLPQAFATFLCTRCSRSSCWYVP